MKIRPICYWKPKWFRQSFIVVMFIPVVIVTIVLGFIVLNIEAIGEIYREITSGLHDAWVGWNGNEYVDKDKKA